MEAHLGGMALVEARRTAARFLATTSPRAIRSAYALEAAPPRRFPIEESLEKIERDRMRAKIYGTEELRGKLRGALARMRGSYLDRAGLREAEGDDEAMLKRFQDALEAIDRTDLGEAFTETLEVMFLDGARSAHLELGLETSFETFKPDASLTKLYQSTLAFAADVTDREVAAIKETILLGVDDGLGTRAIGKLIAAELDFIHVNGRAIAVDTWAEMVARTEVSRAHNAGIMDVYRLVGVKRIRWLAAEDERTCPICEMLDGETAALDEPFEGTAVVAPPEHPSCRCTTVSADDEDDGDTSDDEETGDE